MIYRFAFVFHVFGWIVAVAAVLLGFPLSQEERYYMGRTWYNTNWETVGIAAVVIILAIGITWATRYILTGHKSPLPWVANKEANSER